MQKIANVRTAVKAFPREREDAVRLMDILDTGVLPFPSARAVALGNVVGALDDMGIMFTLDPEVAVFGFDGVPLTVGDVVLFPEQDNRYENGIYVVFKLGEQSEITQLRRMFGADDIQYFVPGRRVFVGAEGEHGNCEYRLLAPVHVLGQSPVIFELQDPDTLAAYPNLELTTQHIYVRENVMGDGEKNGSLASPFPDLDAALEVEYPGSPVVFHLTPGDDFSTQSIEVPAACRYIFSAPAPAVNGFVPELGDVTATLDTSSVHMQGVSVGNVEIGLAPSATFANTIIVGDVDLSGAGSVVFDHCVFHGNVKIGVGKDVSFLECSAPVSCLVSVDGSGNVVRFVGGHGFSVRRLRGTVHCRGGVRLVPHEDLPELTAVSSGGEDGFVDLEFGSAITDVGGLVRVTLSDSAKLFVGSFWFDIEGSDLADGQVTWLRTVKNIFDGEDRQGYEHTSDFLSGHLDGISAALADKLGFNSDGNVVLREKAKILASNTKGQNHELIGLNEYEIEGEVYEQAEVGNGTVHLNLNTNDDPVFGDKISVDTKHGKQILVYQSDLDALIARVEELEAKV